MAQVENIPLSLTDEQKVEILKAKYLDHAEDLRWRTRFDFRFFSGFIALNSAIAIWLTKFPVSTVWQNLGFTFLVVPLGVSVAMLFCRNNRRRRVIVEIMHRLNDVLGFDRESVYGKRPINPASNKKTIYWLRYYLLIVLFIVAGQLAVIWGPAARPLDRGARKIAEGPVTTVTGTSQPEAREITARIFEVRRVVDGDTFKIMYDGELTSVRFVGINAPERDEPAGPAATAALKKLIEGRIVRLDFPGPHKRDNVGRLLAKVYLGDLDVGAEMVRQGHVKAYVP